MSRKCSTNIRLKLNVNRLRLWKHDQIEDRKRRNAKKSKGLQGVDLGAEEAERQTDPGEEHLFIEGLNILKEEIQQVIIDADTVNCN